MKTTIKITQKITRKGQLMITTLNATSFEVADEAKIDKERAIEAFVNAIMRRYNSKVESKIKVPFSLVAPLDMIILFDDEEVFNLSKFSTQTGIAFKFPAHIAKTEGLKAAKEYLKTLLFAAFDEAELFNNEISCIFS